MKANQTSRCIGTIGLLLLATGTLSAAKDSPSARKVLDRHVAAMGGEKAILAPSGMHYTGTFEVQNLEGTFELHRGQGRALFSLDAPGLGKIRQGYDGETGWAMGQTGPQLLAGAELEQMQYLADPASELRRNKDYRSIESLGMRELDGKKLQAIELVTRGGETITEYYDPHTGHRYAAVTTQETPSGKQEEALIYSEHRRFGELELPTRIEQRSAGQVLVRTVEAVTFAPIDDAVFALPDPIQELLEEAE